MPVPRILIVTSGPLCRHPRTLKEATSLGRAGFDVTVLGVAQQERFEAYDREILANAPFRKLSVQLGGRSRRARLRSFAIRLQTWLARRMVPVGLQPASALGPYGALLRLATRTPADLTIVHTEIGLCLGRRLLSSHRRVAADFEDWHSHDLLPEAQSLRPLQLIRRVERELMHRAIYTSTTSHAMAAALQHELGGARPIVLANSFPLQPKPVRPPSPGPPAFFWFSQTIGPGRGLELFLSAWRQTRCPSRLCLLGDTVTGYRDKLLQTLPEARRPDLEFLPLTSPEALPALIARHDIGLALEATVPANKDLTISNKILQYLNAGLAVVASDTAGQREVLEHASDAGLLVSLTETTALVGILDALLAAPGRLVEMGAAARRAAEQSYCWECEAPRLVAAVERALAA